MPMMFVTGDVYNKEKITLTAVLLRAVKISKFVSACGRLCLVQLLAFWSRRITALIHVATSSSSLAVSGTANIRYQTNVPSTMCSRCSTTDCRIGSKVRSSLLVFSEFHPSITFISANSAHIKDIYIDTYMQ